LRTISHFALTLAVLCAAETAGAQPEPPSPDAPPPAPVPAPTPRETLPAPAPAAPVAAAVKPEEKKAEEKAWYQKIKPEAFIDGYASINYNIPIPFSRTTPEGGIPIGGNQLRAFDVNNGFALHWAGLNVSYAPDPIGGAVSLRLGPSATIAAGTDAEIGLEFLKQAYVSLRPGGEKGKFQLDFGKFDTFIGAEVADSQYNMNYTRSILFQLSQPLFHTGLRGEIAFTQSVSLKLFAVNGWNATVDNNAGKSFGGQFTLKPADEFMAALGYLGGPEQSDSLAVVCQPGTRFNENTGACVNRPNDPGGTFAFDDTDADKRWRHLIDLVIDINPTKKLRFLANADAVFEKVAGGNVKWFGGNLTIGYKFVDQFGMALRGGILADSDGAATGSGVDTLVGDGTITFTISPNQYFQVMVDNRLDVSNRELFQKKTDANTTKTQFSTTIGAIVTTGP
jgi:hypothetical protein